MTPDLIVFLATWMVFLEGLCVIFAIKHAAELHHLYYGMAGGILFYALGLPWWAALIPLYVTFDDAMQHTVQLIRWDAIGKKGDPELLYHSPLNLLYGWVIAHV